MRKLIFVFLLVVFAVSIFVAEEIKIGVVLPMTGGISAFGQMTWEGISLAHKMYPTVLGKEVKLILFDNRSEKTEAANAVARAIDKEHVVAIIGEVASSHSLAGGPIAEKNHIPMVSPASTNPMVTQGKKYVSRVCFIDPFQGAAAAVFAFKNLGAKTVAVFTDIEQDYSVGLSKFFVDKFKKLGGKVVSLYYRTGDQDFTAQLTIALSKNPDAIYVTGYYPEIALLSRQARQLGFKGYLLAGDGAEAPELFSIGGDAVDGLFLTTHYHPKGAATSMAKKFYDAFVKEYGKDPSALAALGFDAYLLIIDAIKRAGSADPEAIAKAIRETENFEAVTGVITIEKETGNPIKDVVVDKANAKEKKFDFAAIVSAQELK